MKDPDSRLRSEFTGDIPHFQPSVEWVLPARFTPFDDLELSIQDTVAKKVIQVIPAIGRIEFDHQGDRYSLEVADVHGAPVIFFADATSGREQAAVPRDSRREKTLGNGIREIEGRSPRLKTGVICQTFNSWVVFRSRCRHRRSRDRYLGLLRYSVLLMIRQCSSCTSWVAVRTALLECKESSSSLRCFRE